MNKSSFAIALSFVALTLTSSAMAADAPAASQLELARKFSPLQYCAGSSYPVASWQQVRDFKEKYSAPASGDGKSAAASTDASVLAAPAAVYPTELEGTGQAGSVAMFIAVSADGTVTDALVVCTSHQAFSTAALASAHSSKFNPALRNGQPVTDVVLLPFNFRP